MRQVAVALVLVAMLALVHAPEVLGGAGQGGPLPQTSGPAVNATIVTDPTWGSPNLGRTTIRLSKGSDFSAATFVAEPNGGSVGAEWPDGWHRGCDGAHGVDQAAVDSEFFTITEDTVATLTDKRFKNDNLSEWVPADIVSALFAGLGMSGIDPNRPVITDIDHPVCTEVDGGYILSFTAVIQFEK